MQVSLTVADLAGLVRPLSSRGHVSVNVRGIAALTDAAEGDLSFLGNPKYKADVAKTKASVVLLPAGFEGEPGPGQLYLLVENPSLALAQICGRLEQSLWPQPKPGIHPSAVVAADAVVAPSATIGPLCVIESGAHVGDRAHLQAQVFLGRSARIGAGSWLMPGVSVAAECEVGARVRLHSGVVIGSDGFGYEFVHGRHSKVPQIGNVIIGDDVEIGANSTIDRARFSRTLVGEGTKVDNLVQIAHNVTIGRHCLLCAQVGLSGSTILEDYVVLGGQAGTAGHLRVGKGVKAGGRAGITGDVPAGAFVNGNPAIPYLLERRLVILSQRLPELFKRVDAVEALLRDAKKASS